MFVLFAGMLFWTKLRLVSDIPRSAYAVPREKQVDRPDAPSGVDDDPAPEDPRLDDAGDDEGDDPAD